MDISPWRATITTPITLQHQGTNSSTHIMADPINWTSPSSSSSLQLATNVSQPRGEGGPGGGTAGVPGLSMGENEALQYVTLVLYLITFVSGLFGNGLVIYILLRFHEVRRKSVANIYILNLSIADLVFVLTMPLFCYATFTKDWIFGGAMCKLFYVLR